MEPAVAAAVAAIHASPATAVIAATGCASQALSWLLGAPGASKTVLEAVVPYSRRSFLDFVRRNCKAQSSRTAADQFASPAGAGQLALAAYNRALALSPPGFEVWGIGCTGALVTSNPKRGAHRCHVAALSQTRMLEYSLHLDKGLGRSRWQEDDLSSRLLLKALADASLGSGAGALAPQEAQEVSSLLLGSIPSVSLEAAGDNAALHEGAGQGDSGACGDRLEQAALQLPVAQQLERVLDGVSPLASFSGPSTAAGTQPSATSLPGLHGPFAREGRRVVLSGSFNPLHHGHTTLMTAALELVPNGVPCFEIAGVNADKGKIPAAELERRVSQFTAQDYLVVVTGEPLFAAKAELLPESTFVIGYDTAIRLINPKYYGDSEERMQGVLLGMGELGCNFIVAPRLVAGDFRSFVDLSVPESLSHLFKGLDNFRVDISSTELRQKAKISGL